MKIAMLLGGPNKNGSSSRRRTNGSPGANTRARSGFWMRAFRSPGSPLKGSMSGASTQPQCHSSRGVRG